MSLHLSKCYIVGTHMPQLINNFDEHFANAVESNTGCTFNKRMSNQVPDTMYVTLGIYLN